MRDKRLKETGQRESQKHRAAHQHVQKGTESRTGKGLHRSLGFHLGVKEKGKLQADKSISEYKNF